jgi:malate dehydrogenase (oxaloacetate-decarboxylating)(NADP+)
MSISGRRISGFNPMAAVDIDAIEAQMKMAALDTLKGYSAEHYGIVKQYRETDYIAERNAGGYQVLREPAWNKGTYTLDLFIFY